MKAAIAPPSIDLQQVAVVLLEDEEQRRRARILLEAEHYLGDVQAVGEQIWHAAVGPDGGWLGVLVHCAAARRLAGRDRWIGWSEEQRRRRLALVASNSRFLICRETAAPSLASRVLRLSLGRLRGDWLERYGHPVELVETFVDPERFRGTLYTASGWVELGLTDGCGRVRRDFYEAHGKPKRLFVRELSKGARRALAADRLKPALAVAEARVFPRPTQSPGEIRTVLGHFKALPDYRGRVGVYPLFSLVAIVFLAHLCGAPRGQKDLEKFAAGLSPAQRRALGIRRQRDGRYPSPSQPTFHRLMNGLDGAALEATLLRVQSQIRGEPPADELVDIDGKKPRHGRGNAVLSAVTSTTQHYLGSAIVPTDKTNEIPVARELFGKLDLDGRKVCLDALHTQTRTARDLVLDQGADWFLTVKDNQPGVRDSIRRLADEPPAVFSP